MPADDAPPVRKRRPRYPGKNTRAFHEKYKELNPERYEADVRKIVESGKTPAGMRRAILDRIQPGGRLIGLDVDPIELPRAEERLRAAGFGADTFVAH